MEKEFSTKTIAESAGIKRRHLQSILSGSRKPSAEVAKRLEKASKIDRLAWLYPDEYPNAMVYWYKRKPA